LSNGNSLYFQNGTFRTEDDLQIHFDTQFPSKRKGYYHLTHAHNPNSYLSCSPYTEVLDISFDDISVLYKTNTVNPKCSTHKFIIVGIVVSNFLTTKESFALRGLLEDQVVPHINSKRARPSTSKENCQCPSLGGFSKTFGCVLLNMQSHCRFSGRKSQLVNKFEIATEHENFEVAMNNLADKVSSAQEMFTPIANSNMRSVPGYECRIGNQDTNPFAAVTLLHDYVAHEHLDYNDTLVGNTCIVSFQQNNVLKPQLHYLPHYRFKDGNGHGVAFRLNFGSLLIEAASLEKHGSSPIYRGENESPKRLALVFFTHRCLDKPSHGQAHSN
jgi:hypothetical protein